MSSNKYRYYEVTTTSVVQALNQTDAIKLSQNKRGVVGRVLSEETSIDRVGAAYANEFQAAK